MARNLASQLPAAGGGTAPTAARLAAACSRPMVPHALGMYCLMWISFRSPPGCAAPATAAASALRAALIASCTSSDKGPASAVSGGPAGQVLTRKEAGLAAARGRGIGWRGAVQTCRHRKEQQDGVHRAGDRLDRPVLEGHHVVEGVAGAEAW